MTEIIIDVKTGEFKETARLWKPDIVSQFSSIEWITEDKYGQDHNEFIRKLNEISETEELIFNSLIELYELPFMQAIKSFYLESEACIKWIQKQRSKEKKEANMAEFENWFKENILHYLNSNTKIKFVETVGEMDNESIYENYTYEEGKLVMLNREMTRTVNIPMKGVKGYNVPRRPDFLYEEPIKGKMPLSERARIINQCGSKTLAKYAIGDRKNGKPRMIGAYNHLKSYVPEIDETFILDRPEYFQFTNLFIRDGFSKIMLTGDPGVGKSELAQQICARMNLPCIRIDFSGEVTAEQFLWSKNYDPEQKKMIVEEGIMPFAIRNGIKVIIEEFSSIPPSVAFELHRLFEKGSLYIKDNDTLIKPHPMFSIVMTDNRVGNTNQSKFFGTQPQNSALLDRIDVNVWIPYPDAKTELKILDAKFPELIGVKLQNPSSPTENTKESLFEILINFANNIRSKYTQGDIGITLSPRSVVKFMTIFLRTADLQEAFTLSVLNFHKGLETDKAFLEELFKAEFGKKPKLAEKEVKEVKMLDNAGELDFARVVNNFLVVKPLKEVESET